MSLLEQTNPDHFITVTPTVFGRREVECRCGLFLVAASKADAVRKALTHHHEAIGACTCPPDVVALAEHPSVPTSSGPDHASVPV